MNVDIEKYLSEEEIKQACIDAVKEHAINKLGINESSIANRIAFQVVKKEHQKYVMNYKDIINNKIVEAIDKITLGTLFFRAWGFSNDGHKMFNQLLTKHSKLLEQKLIKTFK